MNNYNEEFQKLELDELEGVAGGLDFANLNPEERKHFMSLRAKYIKLKKKKGTEAYDPEAESDAYRAMMQYVGEMEQKYGK